MLPKALANPRDVIKGGQKEMIVCEPSNVTPISRAILAVLLAVLIIVICVAVWRKQ